CVPPGGASYRQCGDIVRLRDSDRFGPTESVIPGGYSRPMTKHEFEAAWLPHDPARTFDEAAELAIEWAEAQAARRGLPTVLVTDEKGAYAGNRLFDRFAKGRHASPRSPRVDVQPGAVVTHVP